MELLEQILKRLERAESDVRKLVDTTLVLARTQERLSQRQDAFKERLDALSNDGDRKYVELFAYTNDELKELNDLIKDLEETDEEHQKHLHIRQGKKHVLGNVWQIILALLSSGILYVIWKSKLIQKIAKFFQ